MLFYKYFHSIFNLDKICYFQFVSPVPVVQLSAPQCFPLTIKQIMYIRPNLKVFEALFKLKHSPLLNHVLHPKYNCVQPYIQQFEYVGFVSLTNTLLSFD